MKWSIIPRSFAAIQDSKIVSAACTARDALTDSLFPRCCPVCGEIVSPPGWQVCRDCFPKLLFVEPPVCMKCGKSVEDAAEAFCHDCAAGGKSFEYGVALLNYDDVMQRAVTRIKYGNRREYIRPFAALLEERYGKELRRLGADCMIPVPVHPSRLKTRGFNQAELLARELSPYLGIPVRPEFLSRTRKTEAQKELTPDERVRNLSRAFTADLMGEKINTVILADDIYTTGSTVEACSRALRAAGVSRIYYVSICIVPEA